MILYVLRRLLQLVPVFLCASFLIFSIIHLLPGDPVQVMLGDERYDESQDADRLFAIIGRQRC